LIILVYGFAFAAIAAIANFCFRGILFYELCLLLLEVRINDIKIISVAAVAAVATRKFIIIKYKKAIAYMN
jgi:hypothetical protein